MKIKGLVAILLSITLVLSLVGCGSKDAPEGGDLVSGSAVSVSTSDGSVSGSDWYSLLTDEQRLCADVVISSTDALNNEDIDAYMALIDKQSEAYDTTFDDVLELFELFDLTATIDSITVESISGDSCVLLVTQSTVRRGTEGKVFTPMQTELRHTLVRRADGYKLSSTVVLSRKELTNKWDAFIDFVKNAPVSSSDIVSHADVEN